jgi:hypothetical protein
MGKPAGGGIMKTESQIKEILRKEYKRNNIAHISYLNEEETIDHLNYSYLLDQNKETLELMNVV